MKVFKIKIQHIYPKISRLFTKIVKFSFNPRRWIKAYLRWIENKNKSKLWLEFDQILKINYKYNLNLQEK